MIHILFNFSFIKFLLYKHYCKYRITKYVTSYINNFKLLLTNASRDFTFQDIHCALGHETSPLNSLWHQLLFLEDLIDQLKYLKDECLANRHNIVFPQFQVSACIMMKLHLKT